MGGRQEKPIDIKELEKIAALQSSQREAAAHFGVDESTLRARLKRPEYAKAWEKGRCKGRLAVREMQMKAAQDGNITAQIWWGKQYLDQTDKLDTRLLHQNINALIDIYQNVAKTYVPEDKWEEFCAGLRRGAAAYLET